MALRILFLIGSAAVGAGLFILLRENAGSMQMASFTTSFLGAPAPVAGLVLAFPAVYLLWEHQD